VKTRTIAIVTGTRAEYGLLAPVIDAIDARRGLSSRLIVGGVHLSSGTWKQITHPIHARVPMQKRGETGRDADVAALGRGVANFGKAFAQLRPDVVLLLGDRIEIFAAASAASVGGYRVAHIHGGDRAEGVADEAMRHATSKLAHLHFAASAQSRRRLVRMGENPRYVFNVGSPAVAGLRDIAAIDNDTLAQLAVDPANPYVVVMHHPVGSSDSDERRMMDAILCATAKQQRVVMAPNHDSGRNGIMRAIASHGIQPITHLPRAQFLGLLKRCDMLLGNSSAGLIEASAVMPGGVKVINIGTRQGGRERPGNVIDCDADERAIRAAMRKPQRRCRHPYGKGDAPEQMAEILATIDLKAVPVRKCNSY
jgi:UDP-hydrolysing UDP-N-acetyl-D-glucosamine 2-epimerase